MQLTIVLPIKINCDSDDKSIQDKLACEAAKEDENVLATMDLLIDLGQKIRKFHPEIEAHFCPCVGVYANQKL